MRGKYPNSNTSLKMSEKKYFIEFKYNDRGHGNLILRQDSLVTLEVPTRTGSLKFEENELRLVNAIKPGLWYILLPSVDTTEIGMERTPGKGWKIRLFTEKKERTHYLIHPDANKPGTDGCLGLLDTDGLTLRHYLDRILRLQSQIEVFINIPSPADKEKSQPDPLQSVLVPGRKKRRSWGKAIARIWGRVWQTVDACFERFIKLFCE